MSSSCPSTSWIRYISRLSKDLHVRPTLFGARFADGDPEESPAMLPPPAKSCDDRSRSYASLLIGMAGTSADVETCGLNVDDPQNAATAYHLPSVALMPSHTAPTKPVTITVIIALKV